MSPCRLLFPGAVLRPWPRGASTFPKTVSSLYLSGCKPPKLLVLAGSIAAVMDAKAGDDMKPLTLESKHVLPWCWGSWNAQYGSVFGVVTQVGATPYKIIQRSNVVTVGMHRQLHRSLSQCTWVKNDQKKSLCFSAKKW
ncbi:unnamed protein product [Ostreobium quekettii]|uniref:Uncharacterized protein n=1 Tax=Ostreobium quekettii TaxID=121088 RepID=A0A8S1ILW7_9CHLO|nr:unnamed protein product [Ostreobium quekettii]